MLDATGLIIVVSSALLVIFTIRVYERLLSDVRFERDLLLEETEELKAIIGISRAAAKPNHPTNTGERPTFTVVR